MFLVDVADRIHTVFLLHQEDMAVLIQIWTIAKMQRKLLFRCLDSSLAGATDPHTEAKSMRKVIYFAVCECICTLCIYLHFSFLIIDRPVLFCIYSLLSLYVLTSTTSYCFNCVLWYKKNELQDQLMPRQMFNIVISQWDSLSEIALLCSLSLQNILFLLSWVLIM